jgi:ATP-dependent helicase HrpB
MPLLDVPTAEAVQQAEQTLARLGAWHQGAITPLGHRLLALAVHPRLARMVLGAHALGIGDLGCRAAAVLSLGPGAAKSSEGAHHVKHALGHSDLEPLCAPQALTFEAKRAHKSLLAALSALPRGPKVAPHTDAMALLEEALLLGFSDRLVRRLPPLGPKAGPLPVALGWGGKGTLSAHSCVRDNPLMLALAAGQRGERHGDVTVDIAHGVAPESLLALDDGRLQEGCDVMVSPQHGRVEKVETLSYDNLLIHEIRSQQVTPDEAREALADWLNRHRAAVLQQRQAEPEYQQLLARLMAVAEQGDWGPLWGEPTAPNASSQAPSIPEQLQVALMQVLLQLSASCRSVAQLQAQPAAMVLAQSLAQPWQQALRQNAPLQVTLGSGRTVKVTYLEGQKPFIASYLQDFFGSTQGPTVGASRVPLTLHLLGPNRQPLQVTQDLANFWREHYPKLRPALARRYPRHLWPTDPLTATPPAPRKGRR